MPYSFTESTGSPATSNDSGGSLVTCPELNERPPSLEVGSHTYPTPPRPSMASRDNTPNSLRDETFMLQNPHPLADTWYERDNNLYFPVGKRTPVPLPATSAAIPFLPTAKWQTMECDCTGCRQSAMLPILSALAHNKVIPSFNEKEIVTTWSNTHQEYGKSLDQGPAWESDAVAAQQRCASSPTTLPDSHGSCDGQQSTHTVITMPPTPPRTRGSPQSYCSNMSSPVVKISDFPVTTPRCAPLFNASNFALPTVGKVTSSQDYVSPVVDDLDERLLLCEESLPLDFESNVSLGPKSPHLPDGASSLSCSPRTTAVFPVRGSPPTPPPSLWSMSGSPVHDNNSLGAVSTGPISQASSFTKRIKDMSLCDSPLTCCKMFHKSGLVCPTHDLPSAFLPIKEELDVKSLDAKSPHIDKVMPAAPSMTQSHIVTKVDLPVAGQARSALNAGHDNKESPSFNDLIREYKDNHPSLLSPNMRDVSTVRYPSGNTEVILNGDVTGTSELYGKSEYYPAVSCHTSDNVTLQSQRTYEQSNMFLPVPTNTTASVKYPLVQSRPYSTDGLLESHAVTGPRPGPRSSDELHASSPVSLLSGDNAGLVGLSQSPPNLPQAPDFRRKTYIHDNILSLPKTVSSPLATPKARRLLRVGPRTPTKTKKLVGRSSYTRSPPSPHQPSPAKASPSPVKRQLETDDFPKYDGFRPLASVSISRLGSSRNKVSDTNKGILSHCMAPPQKKLAFEGSVPISITEEPSNRFSPSLTNRDIDNLASNIALRLSSIMPNGVSPSDEKETSGLSDARIIAADCYGVEAHNFGNQLSAPSHSMVTPAAPIGRPQRPSPPPVLHQQPVQNAYGDVTSPASAPSPPPIIVHTPPPLPVKEIPPDKYELGQDWDVYVNSFHDLAVYNKWDSYTAAQRLKFSLSQKALEMAHNVAQLPPRCTFGHLVGELNPIFGSIYKEGKAATLFDQRNRDPSESYHDYMLELFKLFNKAYPHENPLSRSQRISKRFILGIGDQNLAQYLADQSYSGPMELVKLAERRQCLFIELQNANRGNIKVADASEPETYPALPEDKRTSSTDNDGKSRLHPADLKAIGESVSQSLGSKLSQRRSPYYNRGQQGRKWPPLQPQDWPYRPRNKDPDPKTRQQSKDQGQSPPTQPSDTQFHSGNGQGLNRTPATARSTQ